MTDWAKIREKITELQKAGDVLQVPVNWEEIGKKLAELQTGGDTAPDQSVQEEDKTAEKSETAKAESGQTSGYAEDGNGAGSVPSGQTDAARIREGIRLSIRIWCWKKTLRFIPPANTICCLFMERPTWPISRETG